MELLYSALVIFCILKSVRPAKQFSPFEDVHELLTFGEQLTVPEGDLIFIMGSTGVEKSNLIKFVIQDEGLKVKRRGSKMVFDVSRNQNRSQFHDTLPQFYRDKATGRVLVDIPGFSDSRDPKMDIAAAYFSKKVLDQAENLKVVLVENHANLMEGSDGSGFSKLLRHVSRLVPEVDRLQDSLGFVVAKVHNQEEDDGVVMENVLNFITSFKEDLSAQLEAQFELSAEHNETAGMLRVLDAIYANGTAENLALLRRPDQEGTPWGSPMMSQCQRELRVLLFASLNFHEGNNLHFPYSLAVRSRDFVTQTLIPSNNQMVSHYLGKVLKEFQECVEKEVRGKYLIEEKADLLMRMHSNISELIINSDLFESLPAVMKLKEKLATVCSAWVNVDLNILVNLLQSTELSYNLAGSSFTTFLEEMKSILITTAKRVEEMSNFYDFVSNLNQELQSYHVQAVRKSAHVTLTAANYKEFIFNLSRFNITVANKERVVGIDPTKRMLSDLNSVLSFNLNHTTRRSFNNFGQELIFEGRNLFLSEIVTELPKFQNLQNIYLFAYKSVFIDADVSLLDAHLSIVAPRVEVIGENRSFIVRGSDGQGYPENATLSVHGLPGEDGKDAGNILVIALDILRVNHLSITSIGGNGGKGQNGGGGLDGGEIAPPHFPTVYPDFVNGVANWEKVKGHGYAVEHLDPTSLVLINRKGFRIPSGGGHGGAGGAAGRAGNNLFLSDKGLDDYPAVDSRDGMPGEDGHGGKGGIGQPGCAKKIYKGECKTKHCELKIAMLLFKTKGSCDCGLLSVQFCDKAPDAPDGIKGNVKKNPTQGEPRKSGLDWIDLEMKLSSSVITTAGQQVKENVTDLTNFISYARRTFKTLEQAFRGMNSQKCG